MIPVETIASLGDTLRRNYIASSNEIRRLVGFKPSNDPRADELFNPNIADKNQDIGNPNDSIIRPKTDNELELERLRKKVQRLDEESGESRDLDY